MKKPNTVFYNHGDRPICISCSIITDPFGGPGILESQMIIEPGHGIDISILNLKPKKLRKKP